MPTWDRGDWFPFYPTAFLGDRAIGAMSPEAIGAHILLLAHASSTRGVLPLKDDVLARLSRTGTRWPAVREMVLRGWRVRGKTIVNLRLEAEVHARDRRLSRARESGRAGGIAAAKSRRQSGGNYSDTDSEHSPKPCGTATWVGSLNGPCKQSTITEEPTPKDSATAPSCRSEKTQAAATRRSAQSSRKPGPPGPLDLAWRWGQENEQPELLHSTMRFGGWLVRTGTRDPETLLALVKYLVVHRPKNPFAYFTTEGVTRTSIQTRVAADRQIAEHEAIKAEERKLFGDRRSGMVHA